MVYDSKLNCFGFGCRSKFTNGLDNGILLADTAIGFKKDDGNKNYTSLNFHKSNWKKVSTNDRFIINQFTGEADTHDNDIYKGHILRCSMYADEEKILPVYFEGSSFWIDYDDGEWDRFVLSEFIKIGRVEIIGDIHTTPELLNNK